MTSKKSSADKFGFTLRKGLKTLLPFTFIFFVIAFMMHSAVCVEILDYLFGHNVNREAIRSQYVYFFNSGLNELLFTFSTIAFGCCSALMMFKYMLRKDSVNVCFSLSISRGKYFAAKFLAGFISIFVSSFLPMAISSAINIAFYGFHRETLTAGLFIALKLFTPAMYCFSVAAAVMTLVGSIIETVVYSGVAIFSPVLVDFTIAKLIDAAGNASLSGTMIKHFGGKMVQSKTLLVGFSDLIAPATSVEYMTCRAMTPGESFSYPLTFKSTFIFMAVIAVISAAALFFGKRRKAEKAGFLGTSPFAQGFCVVVVGLYLASAVCTMFTGDYYGGGEIKYTNKALFIAVAAVIIMAVGYTVVDLFLVRSFRKYFRRLRYLALEIVIALLIIAVVLVPASIAAKIPEGRTVESASITLYGNIYDAQTSIDDYMVYGAYSGGYMTGEKGKMRIDRMLLNQTETVTVFDGFTAEEDIALIKEIDSSLYDMRKTGVSYLMGGNSADDPVPCRIRIEYKLDSGKLRAREYTAASSAVIARLSELTQSEHVKKAAAASLRKFCDTENYLGDYFFDEDGEESKTVHAALFSPDFTSTVFPAALYDIEMREKLTSALADDIESGKLPLNYKSDSDVLGYVWLTMQSNFAYENKDEDTPADRYYQDRVLNPSGSYYVAAGDESYLYPVYTDMDNTLAFLKENNLMSYFDKGEEIVKIYTCKYEKADSVYAGVSDTFTLTGVYMSASNLSENGGFDYDIDISGENGVLIDSIGISSGSADGGKTIDSVMPDYATLIEDKAEIEKTAKEFRGIYLSCYEGSYAVMVTESGRLIFGYIPD